MDRTGRSPSSIKITRVCEYKDLLYNVTFQRHKTTNSSCLEWDVATPSVVVRSRANGKPENRLPKARVSANFKRSSTAHPLDVLQRSRCSHMVSFKDSTFRMSWSHLGNTSKLYKTRTMGLKSSAGNA